MNRTTRSFWLFAYACLCCLATLLLICVGGLVTSKGVGMSVPDWPTTFGYNMFLFPVSGWVGGIFYEHSHRLIASKVGLMTILLAVWLWLSPVSRTLKWCGLIAVGAVIFQGILGGLRVIWNMNQVGIFHACLAQAFFCLLGWITFQLSPWATAPVKHASRLQRGWQLLVVLLFLQLAIGATMRHAHAGLSIPDFPTAYGQWWPSLDDAAMKQINTMRNDQWDLPPTTGIQIMLQLAHRVMAVGIVLAIGCLAWKTLQESLPTPARRLAFIAVALVSLQFMLGAWTIWSNKAADVATTHVVIGSLLLLTTVLECAALQIVKVENTDAAVLNPGIPSALPEQFV